MVSKCGKNALFSTSGQVRLYELMSARMVSKDFPSFKIPPKSSLGMSAYPNDS